jgi:hypothetical protein
VEGLKFLEIHKMVHGHLNMSNALVNNTGQVKIGMAMSESDRDCKSLIRTKAEQELCETKSNDNLTSHRDVQDLGNIIMHLTTKNTANTQEIAGPDRRRYSPTLLDFIGATVSATESGLSQV